MQILSYEALINTLISTIFLIILLGIQLLILCILISTGIILADSNVSFSFVQQK